MNLTFANDESTVRVFRIGYQGLADLTEDERVRFGFIYLTTFRIFETLYFQRESGTVDPRLWEAEKRSMTFLLNGAGGREWWRANPYSFTTEFRQFIEAEVLQTEPEPSIHP